MWHLHCGLFMCPKIVLYAIFAWTIRCIAVKLIHFLLWSCWSWTTKSFSASYLYSLSRSTLVTHFDYVSYSIWYTVHLKRKTWTILLRKCHQVFLKFIYDTYLNINNLEEDWFSVLAVVSMVRQVWGHNCFI